MTNNTPKPYKYINDKHEIFYIQRSYAIWQWWQWSAGKELHPAYFYSKKECKRNLELHHGKMTPYSKYKWKVNNDSKSI